MNDKETKKYYTYIILCEDGSYYTGYSDDPQRRFDTHKAGKGAKYTRSHKPAELTIVSSHQTKSEAMKKEHEVKQLSHSQKAELANACKEQHEQKLREAIEQLADFVRGNQ